LRQHLTRILILCSAPLMAHAADVLLQLGIPPQAAKEAVASVINSGIYNPGLPAGAFKLLPAPARRAGGGV
jgi:hypothetical protein